MLYKRAKCVALMLCSAYRDADNRSGVEITVLILSDLVFYLICIIKSSVNIGIA